MLAIALIAAGMFIGRGIAAQADPDELPDSVLVLVNGEPITASQMDQEFMAFHRRSDAGMDKGFDYDKLVGKLVNDRLIVQEATAMGMADEDWVGRILEETKVRRAIRLFIRDHYDGAVEVPEEMMHRYFDSLYHRKQFRTVTVRTFDEANQVRARIMSGVDMDSLARAISLDSYKFKGGLQNFKHWADIPNMFRDVIIHMDSGEIAEPFPFNEAFTVLRLERQAPPDQAEYPYFEKLIRGRLADELKKDSWKAFVDSLGRSVAISTNDSVLNAIRNDASILFTEMFTNYSMIPALSVPTGVVVVEGDLRTEISHAAMAAADTPFDSLFQLNLNQAKQKVILGEAALRQGYGDSSEVTAACRHTLDSALIEVYVKEQVVSKIVFNREDFQAYYDEHQEDFRAAEQFQIFQASLESEEAARQFAARLDEGADFMYLKRQYAADSLAVDKSQEWVSLTTFPESVQEELTALKIGEASRPYATTTGWVVFELKDRRPGRLKSIEEVDMQIRQAIFQQQFDRLMDEHLGILKEHSDIVYNQGAIDGYFRRDGEG